VSGFLFRSDPFGELLGRIDVDAEKHFGVLRAAILGALPKVHAGFVRVDPDGINAIGDQVCFAGELRNPKAVIGVRGEQLDEGGRRMRRIADGNMQFVGGDDAERRIAELPPELMTDRGDLNRAGGRQGIFHGMDDARGGKKEHQNDENGHDGPRQLYLIAAVDLGRLTGVTGAALAKFYDGIRKKRENYGKN